MDLTFVFMQASSHFTVRLLSIMKWWGGPLWPFYIFFLPQRKAFRCIATFHCIPRTSTLVHHNLKHHASISTDPTVNTTQKRWHGLRHHLLRFWKPLPISVGLILLAVLQWRHIRRREANNDDKTVVVAKNWEIVCYRAVPLRALSRVWGWLTNKELPASVRPWIYGSYASTFGCNLEEAANDDLTSYKSLAEFFCRPLREGVRPVNQDDDLVSPADGKIISFGPVDTCKVEQVKGVTYSLQAFLGEPLWTNKLSETKTSEKVNKSTAQLTPEEYRQSLLMNKDTTLYQCVVYLAPGDYHRFHSPVQWDVIFRRHFQGELLSVNPKVAQWIPDLFTLNERAVYVGQWKYGFFSLTAVGATNVGSIRVYCDKELITNQRKWRKMETRQKDAHILGIQGEKVHMCKGEPFGEFRLGSTIVLLFEAPRNYKFRLQPGQRIQVGEGVSKRCV